MGEKLNLVGKKSGRLTVLREHGRDKNGHTLLVCRCNCGNEVIKTASNLCRGDTISCGCYIKGLRIERECDDICGNKYGRLTILREWGKDKYGSILFLCRCECGKEKIVSWQSLKKGETTSCGCFRMQLLREQAVDLSGMRFGRLVALKICSRKLHGTGVIKWTCLCDCGKTHVVTEGNLGHFAVLSCGCLRNDVSGARWKWSKNPSFNPDLTDKDRIGRHAFGKIVDWSLSVKKRDGYTCNVCGKKGGKLESHHLDGWHWCVEKRFEEINGVTLCKNCHNEFHKKFGKKKNTLVQFEKFKKAN